MVIDWSFVAAPAAVGFLAGATWWLRRMPPAPAAPAGATDAGRVNPASDATSRSAGATDAGRVNPASDATSRSATSRDMAAAPETAAQRLLVTGLPEHIVLAGLPLAELLDLPGDVAYREWLDLGAPHVIDLLVCDSTARPILAVALRDRGPTDTDPPSERRARLAQVLEAEGIPLRVWDRDSLPGIDAVRSLVAVRQLPSGTTSGLRVAASRVHAFRLHDRSSPADRPTAAHSPPEAELIGAGTGTGPGADPAMRPALSPAAPARTPAH